jgi:hypothetical protein
LVAPGGKDENSAERNQTWLTEKVAGRLRREALRVVPNVSTPKYQKFQQNNIGGAILACQEKSPLSLDDTG